MTKREILQCGGRRKEGNSVLAFCGPTGLEDMMRHAHFHYYRDVVCGNLSYVQYVIEFVNGHIHHDDTNAQNMNQHCKNHAIVSHLL